MHRASIATTEAGEQLYRTVESRLADIDAELALLAEKRGKPAGTIRLTATEHAVRDMIVRYTDVLLAQVHQSVACNAVHHVEERLCRWLMQAHDRIDGDTLPLTQESLSGMLGVQRTTITAICRMLQAEDILDVRRGRIHVRDFAALQAKACACYGVVRSLTDRLNGTAG